MKLRSSKLFRNKEHGDDRYLRYRKNKTPVFVVLDGVSCASGAAASQLTKHKLKRCKPSSADALVECITQFHTWLTRHVGDEAQTTITACVIEGQVAKTVSVGDSPIYLVDSKRATIRKINRLDSIPGDPSAVTQVIGAGEISPHVQTTKLPARGYLLLCTDGVSDNLTEKELLDVCSGTSHPSVVKRRLKRALKACKRENKGHVYGEFKPDDQTALIIRFKH